MRSPNQPPASDVWSGQELPQLQARAADDFSRLVVQLGDPADLAAVDDGVYEVRPSGLDQRIVHVARQLAHVAEHLRPMARENARVCGGGPADPVHR